MKEKTTIKIIGLITVIAGIFFILENIISFSTALYTPLKIIYFVGALLFLLTGIGLIIGNKVAPYVLFILMLYSLYRTVVSFGPFLYRIQKGYNFTASIDILSFLLLLVCALYAIFAIWFILIKLRLFTPNPKYPQ